MNAPRLLALMFAVTSLFACGVDQTAVAGADEQISGESELSSLRGRFETFVGKDGQDYFHLLAGNGQKVLMSEGYASLQGAQGGIASVQANGQSDTRYLLREASDGSWYFVLTASNGQIIGMSELYVSQANANAGIATVKKVIAATTKQEQAIPGAARYETFKGLDGKYYFHVRAVNGEIVLQSQAYTTRASATTGINSVQTNGINLARYAVLASADGQFYFNLKAANGQVIGHGEQYASKSNAERGAAACQALISAGVAR